jgi:hypothetical protein
MNAKNIGIWILRIVPAVILLQTLYFKFSAHPESVYIFTLLGMEPWGRIGTGTLELLAALLIIYPRTSAWGALLGFGMMAGAIFFHLTSLGVIVNGDALLFVYACITLACCLALILVYRRQLLMYVLHDKPKARAL